VGAASLKRSRTSPGETHPNLFVRPIHARFILYLEEDSVKDGWFSVAMDYDVDGESSASSLAEAVAIPGTSSTH
jgi:hypothetical protein